MGRDVLCDVSGGAWPTLVALQKPCKQPAHTPPSGSPICQGKGTAFSSSKGVDTAAAINALLPCKPDPYAGFAQGPVLVVKNTFLNVDCGSGQPPVLSRSRSCDAVVSTGCSTDGECQVIRDSTLGTPAKCAVEDAETPCNSRGCQVMLPTVKPEPAAMACVDTPFVESNDCPPSPVHWPEHNGWPQQLASAGPAAQAACFGSAAGWPAMSGNAFEEGQASHMPQWAAFPAPGMMIACPAPVAYWATESCQFQTPGAPELGEESEPPADTDWSGPGRRKRGRRPRKTANASTGAVVARLASGGAACGDLDFREMLSQLAAGGEQRRGAIAALRGHFLRAAFDAQGCRVAQAALDEAEREEKAELTSELRGHVREALESPHANFVLQKVVEVMPPAMVQFIVKELTGVAVQTALHCFGCRVICRLLEHCPHGQTGSLVDEVLHDGALLCKDNFGNHVVRHILEHGTPAQRRAVARVLLEDPLQMAGHRNASCVVEKALSHCAAEESSALAGALLRDGDTAAQLACGRYGSYVVRALLECEHVDAVETRALLRWQSPKLQQSKFGRRVLEDLGDERTGAQSA